MTQEEQPMISVAMCTYNGALFLKKQIDSLISQNYPHVEIIIVDDGSTDETIQILNDYQQNYSQIKVFRNESNKGLVKNFEKAIRHTSGEYIALCDQDDIWFPEKLSTLVTELGDASLIYTPVRMIDEQDKPLDIDFYGRRKIQPVSGKCSKALLFDNCILGHTTLFSRSLLDFILPFPDGISAHDQWIAIIAATIGEIKYHDQILSLYRMHQNNAALKTRGQKKSLLGALNRKYQRNRRTRKKYHRQLALIQAVAELEFLPEENRLLFKKISQIYKAYYHIYHNQKLARTLLEEGDEFLAMSKNKEKMLKKICRGYLAEILR
jgi:glycosyltransferase involved in cell wall biosynthesis